MPITFLPMILQILLAAAVGAAITWMLLPLAARVAVALGAVDQPGGRRKHLVPIPRLGGVAVVLATGAACILLALVAQQPFTPFWTAHNQAMLAGALLVFAIGCVDDLHGASPRLKLVVQIVAALLVVKAGGLGDSFVFAKGLPAMHVDGLAPLLAVVWIVGVTNAFNLIDGLDGLASLCAMVALATMVASGLYIGQASSFVFVAALFGALAVFLRRNWHPASVFLGDAGSMTIGFLLAVRVIPSATSVDGHIHVLVPLAALSYPLLDTGVAILRRWLRGHSFSRADGRHIHHQLVAIGMSVPRAVRVISTISAVVATAALTISFAPPHLTVALAVGASLLASAAALYSVWLLEYSEFIAFGKALYSGLARSRRIVRERIRMADIAKHIKSAATEPEVHACLRDLVDFEHVRRAELVDPLEMVREVRGEGTPPTASSTMVRLECPVQRVHKGRVLQLRVWVTPTGVAHHTLQRVEHMICRELEMWFGQFDKPIALVEQVERSSTPARTATGVRADASV